MPTVARPIQVFRLLRLACSLLWSIILLPLFACRGSQGKARTIRKRTSAMLRALGATVQVHGDATLGVPVEGPPRGALMVTNHLSFLDSVVLYALWPIRSVAKREVSRWPVHGTLARAARTIFIDRDQARALSKVVSVMGDALRDGSLISAFPQGGIRCCLRHGGFRPAMFQAAVDGGVPVRPVAIRYRLADGTSTMWPAYIDETLIAMMARTARLRGLVIEVHVMPEIASDAGVSRRELSVLAEAAVVNALTGAVTRQPSPLHS